jgi:hypothetical protein
MALVTGAGQGIGHGYRQRPRSCTNLNRGEPEATGKKNASKRFSQNAAAVGAERSRRKAGDPANDPGVMDQETPY